jgi:SAM-dependent methyltransferase
MLQELATRANQIRSKEGIPELVKKTKHLPKLFYKRNSREDLINRWEHDEYENRERTREHRRSYVLAKEIEDHTSKNESILDIGCSTGRDLSHLYNLGYHNLWGIDPNKEAVTDITKFHPELSGEIKTFAEPVEKVITDFDTNRFGTIYTNGTLCVIHPESAELVFDQISNICRNILITVEKENVLRTYQFSRNYREIFEKRGFTQIKHWEGCNEGLFTHRKIRVFESN